MNEGMGMTVMEVFYTSCFMASNRPTMKMNSYSIIISNSKTHATNLIIHWILESVTMIGRNRIRSTYR